MTHQDDPKEDQQKVAQAEKTPPPIKFEEDVPFNDDQQATTESGTAPDKNLANTDSLKATIIKFKYKTGARVLFAAMAAMGVFALLEAIISGINPDAQTELINSAFEAFKLITMTVLGFIFGSNDTRSN